jgi:hypothetical protein
MITADTTLPELATIVSEALEQSGIIATLASGRVVTLYSDTFPKIWMLSDSLRLHGRLANPAVTPLPVRSNRGHKFYVSTCIKYYL